MKHFDILWNTVKQSETLLGTVKSCNTMKHCETLWIIVKYWTALLGTVKHCWGLWNTAGDSVNHCWGLWNTAGDCESVDLSPSSACSRFAAWLSSRIPGGRGQRRWRWSQSLSSPTCGTKGMSYGDWSTPQVESLHGYGPHLTQPTGAGALQAPSPSGPASPGRSRYCPGLAGLTAPGAFVLELNILKLLIKQISVRRGIGPIRQDIYYQLCENVCQVRR